MLYRFTGNSYTKVWDLIGVVTIITFIWAQPPLAMYFG